MSVDFRQRTPGEYARILWKRKWLIILPTIAIATAIALVVLKLPDVYESTTLVVVKPPTIPTNVVQPLTTDLTLLLNNINQVVTSRSTLEPLIVKYRPYAIEESRGEPMELLVEQMRKDMNVEIDKSRDDSTSGFRISYRGRDPRVTQAVTAELANKYVVAQLQEVVNTTKKTTELFDSQMEDVKKQLEDIDHRRLEFMQQNLPYLPSGGPALIGQLTGLHEQQKALIAETGRLRDQRTLLSNQLGDLSEQRAQDAREIARKITDPKTTLGWSQLVQQKAMLESELQMLKSQYTPKHPDVIAKQSQLDSIKNEMDQMVEEWKFKINEEEQRLGGLIDPRVKTLEYNLKLVDTELVRQEHELQQTSSALNDIQQRINKVPGAQVALESLDREYQTTKARYDELLETQSKVKTSADVANTQQGEKIQVLDPASLPQRPVAPKRLMLIGMGLGLGLLVGLLCASFVEVPRLLTIQTTNDAEHYTGLPVLVAVPELLTPQEAKRVPRRRLLWLAAGIVIAIASIPALALALKASHIFDRFVS
ncbi:MAG TPA: Wzz/FepE/Etk N-terminal domain-containing protein [Pyrinomonadaceae bacterium]